MVVSTPLGMTANRSLRTPRRSSTSACPSENTITRSTSPQGWGVELVGELLGAGGEIAQGRVEGGMEGGHQRNAQLLAQLRQPEIEGGEGEAGVDQIRFEALQ